MGKEERCKVCKAGRKKKLLNNCSACLPVSAQKTFEVSPV